MPGQKEDYRRAEQEYRRHAEELSKIAAEQTVDSDERERLLRMADAWLKLAEKMKVLGGGA
jgi:ATP-dependent protease ClpP protease subunit